MDISALLKRTMVNTATKDTSLKLRDLSLNAGNPLIAQLLCICFLINKMEIISTVAHACCPANEEVASRLPPYHTDSRPAWTI